MQRNKVCVWASVCGLVCTYGLNSSLTKAGALERGREGVNKSL